MNNFDDNGLMLSERAYSGYKFVTVLFDGPYAGKYIAFADVPSHLQKQKAAFGSNNCFGFSNIQTLGVFDDVRDAAYVGQTFFNEGRDENLVKFFAGDMSVVPVPPSTWKYEPHIVHYNNFKKASDKYKEKLMNKIRSDIKQNIKNSQDAFYFVYSKNKDKYNITKDDVANIRMEIEQHHPRLNIEYICAAEMALEQYIR
jgi:hypothetical protein